MTKNRQDGRKTRQRHERFLGKVLLQIQLFLIRVENGSNAILDLLATIQKEIQQTSGSHYIIGECKNA